MGRSRGGCSTKVHATVNGLGLPVQLVRTPGQAADVTHAALLVEGVPCAVVSGDRGYDRPALVDAIEVQGGEAVIASLSTRAVQRDYDREGSQDRNLAERFGKKVKHYRRIASRSEKTARNFWAFVHGASLRVRLP